MQGRRDLASGLLGLRHLVGEHRLGVDAVHPPAQDGEHVKSRWSPVLRRDVCSAGMTVTAVAVGIAPYGSHLGSRGRDGASRIEDECGQLGVAMPSLAMWVTMTASNHACASDILPSICADPAPRTGTLMPNAPPEPDPISARAYAIRWS